MSCSVTNTCCGLWSINVLVLDTGLIGAPPPAAAPPLGKETFPAPACDNRFLACAIFPKIAAMVGAKAIKLPGKGIPAAAAIPELIALAVSIANCATANCLRLFSRFSSSCVKVSDNALSESKPACAVFNLSCLSLSWSSARFLVVSKASFSCSI